MSYDHIPVLLNEVLGLLHPQPGESYVDATLGGGGYSLALLESIQPEGQLLSIDLDNDAIQNANLKKQEFGRSRLWTLAHGNFSHIDKIIKNHDFPAPNGIVADIGLSSYELDQSGRGMSFQKKEPLDMRFDLSWPEDAKFLLNNKTEQELARIFEDLGEEKFSRAIARNIQNERNKKPIHYTTDLYEIIQDALPKPVKHKADDSARRIFQALRIAVNRELENLEEFLPKAFDVLVPGGKLAVVSFHSLEDRIVKQFFVSLTKGCVCPPDFPQCICGKEPLGKILTKKPVTASEEELVRNPRSRPAKLRVIQKL